MKTNSTILILAALLVCQPAGAASSYFVPTMTNFTQEALTWCGPATGQTIATGYPSGTCTLLQSDVWDAIQAKKVEASWDTDPAGLAGGLMAACPLTPGHSWVVFHNSSASAIMYSVALYMTYNHFPVAVLLSTDSHNSISAHREHWVTVKGIVVNADPMTTSSVTLQYILIVDQPENLGDPAVERWLSGSQWYAEFKPVSISSSTYKNEYVAVIEPPTRSGTASARPLPVRGTILPIDRIAALAQRALQNDALRQVPSFRELAALPPGRPVLVNAERGGAYYIVPFGGPAARGGGAVLINAYSGDFMEAARLKTPPMLSNNDALERVRAYLGKKDVKAGKASLVYTGGSPYVPVWELNVDGRDLQVLGNGHVRPPRPIR